MFVRPDELAAWHAVFGIDTWLFLSAAALAIVGSIIFALLCLRTRLHEATAAYISSNYKVDPDNIETYVPAVSWWYGMIGVMNLSSRFSIFKPLMACLRSTRSQIRSSLPAFLLAELSVDGDQAVAEGAPCWAGC